MDTLLIHREFANIPFSFAYDNITEERYLVRYTLCKGVTITINLLTLTYYI